MPDRPSAPLAPGHDAHLPTRNPSRDDWRLDRRRFLQGAAGVGLVAVSGASLVGCSADYGPLLAPDANGLALPAGFTSRIVATTGVLVAGTAYTWHTAPDGGATFATRTAGELDGGWIYVSNSEWVPGGAGMIRFDAAGAIIDARRILAGTIVNCAGGKTPWDTWLSCEEVDNSGQVWECDIYGVAAGVARPAMGKFKHEAAAVDPVQQRVYLTEDRSDGALYRFTPAAYPDLATGTLEVMTDVAGTLGWGVVADPSGAITPTRNQVPNTKRFNGGEGISWKDGVVVFATKGDNRLWKYDTVSGVLSILYDDDTSATPILTGVDNVTFTDPPISNLFVAEDGGDMQVVSVDGSTGAAYPFCQVTGRAGSEITGPAMSPNGQRMYFSSQRTPGETFEVRWPGVS